MPICWLTLPPPDMVSDARIAWRAPSRNVPSACRIKRRWHKAVFKTVVGPPTPMRSRKLLSFRNSGEVGDRRKPAVVKIHRTRRPLPARGPTVDHSQGWRLSITMPDWLRVMRGNRPMRFAWHAADDQRSGWDLLQNGNRVPLSIRAPAWPSRPNDLLDAGAAGHIVTELRNPHSDIAMLFLQLRRVFAARVGNRTPRRI